MRQSLIDAYGNLIRSGTFYAGPHRNEHRAQLYYAVGMKSNNEKVRFVIESSNGQSRPLTVRRAATLYAIPEANVVIAHELGRISIENREWFKKRTGIDLKLK